jgi:hypothetical protein
MVAAGPFNGSLLGHTLVIVGAELFNVRLTVMFWDFVVTGGPEATTVIFAT